LLAQFHPQPRRPWRQTPIDPALSEELLRTFPDLATQSFEAVAKVMRERTLEEFKIAAAEMQTKVGEAQKALAEAQANKSEAAVTHGAAGVAAHSGGAEQQTQWHHGEFAGAHRGIATAQDSAELAGGRSLTIRCPHAAWR
jgi:hypothetical protein